MRTKIIELMGKKQIESKRQIDAATIIRETKLSRPTITKWMKGRVKSFDEQTVVTLCHYFECDIGDLLTIVEDDAEDAQRNN